MISPDIVFIGAGNVASHLAPAIERSGAGCIKQVYSHTLAHASELASKLKSAVPIDDQSQIIPDADIYIISIKDDGIVPLVDALAGKMSRNALWVHTSGSIAMEVLAPLTERYGVYYPMQTFSKEALLDMAKVPLFVEGNTPDVEAQIQEFAEKVFANVYHADSDLRRKMHIAAVFSCNFTNYMWVIADELLRKEGLSFDVMRPLLEETMRKAFASSPEKGQTGPAVRGDTRVMDRHKSMLSERDREIYELISRRIFEHFNG